MTTIIPLGQWCRMQPMRAGATMVLLALGGLVGATHALCGGTPPHLEDRPPNFVILVADDLGWSDLACYGHLFHETPNLDALAAGGARFTAAYAAAPVCSPTRASIQTGRHPARYGLTAHIPGHWRPFEKLAEPPPAQALPLEAETLGERLKAHGYRTGYFGKWHLGGNGFGPTDQGYDEALEFSSHNYPPGQQAKPDQPRRRGPEVLADKAVDFINRQDDRPFLLQVHYFAVHIPLQADPRLEAKYRAKPQVEGRPPARPDYAALLEEMDTSIGRILNALNQRGLDSNTWVVFLSDNGGLERESGGWPGTSNRPLRDQKGTLYEGGIRIPMIARIPGLTKPGTVVETPVVTHDLAPTLLAAAHPSTHTHPPDRFDGLDLRPWIGRPETAPPDRALYWHYPHYHTGRPSGAIQRDGYKLIEFFETGTVELYNLANDLGETHDLAAQPDHAERRQQLLSELRFWRHQVNAQMPQRNPAYDPDKANQWWSRVKVEPVEPPGAYRP